MRNIKIVADSSCDVFDFEGVRLDVAPLKIVTAEREFVDNEGLDVEAMVEYLYNLKGKSSSSCPNTNDWLSAFGDADEIFCVTITGGLSGSYNSACLAKRQYEEEHPGARVCVFDSLSTGPEMTLIIEKIAQYIKDGMEFEEICESVNRYMKSTGLLFVLKSLKNFANNGRISPLVAKLVGIAGICIVGKASEKGTLEPLHKPRGEKRALETLVDLLRSEGYCSGKVSIGHCMNLLGAERLKDMIVEAFGKVKVEIHALRGLCSFYAEKGGILVGFEKG